jgi:vacuolar-type H+-ATPase subunit I/STV1
MKIYERILLFLAVEAVNFVVLTGFLCGIGFFTLPGGDTPVTFRILLWTGTVSFWFEGYGPVLLLCLAVVIIWCILAFCHDALEIEKRRRNMDKEVESKAKEKAEGLRSSIREEILRELAARIQDLQRHSKRLHDEREELSVRAEELQNKELKIQNWRDELHAVREKDEKRRDRWKETSQRLAWARAALQETPPNVGLAVRHLKKVEKI